MAAPAVMSDAEVFGTGSSSGQPHVLSDADVFGPPSTGAGETFVDELKKGALEAGKAGLILGAPLARLFGKNAEDETFALAHRVGQAADSYTPNPTTLLAKGAGFGGAVLPKIGEAVIDPAVLLAESGTNRAATGAENGETTPQALTAGAITGALNYLGAKIPVGGGSVGGTLAKAAGLGITLPVAGTAAEHLVDPRLTPGWLPSPKDIAESIAMYAVPGLVHHAVGGVPEAPTHELTPEQMRLIGVKHQQPVLSDAQVFDHTPTSADEAQEQLHKPVEVSDAATPENVTLQGTDDEKLQDELAEHAQQPTTKGINVTPGTIHNVELSEPFEPPAEPATNGIKSTEIPQTEITGDAENGNTRVAVLDAHDQQLRATLRKPVKDMTPEEKDLAINTDPMTLLPNRRAFDERDGETPAKAYSAIDLVGFKKLNDTIGHAAGDQVLEEWGRILRGSGLEAYRTGGDEFTVRGESRTQLQQAMQTLKEHLQGRSITVTGPNGEPLETGLDFRYGIAKTPHLADIEQIRARGNTPGRGEDLGARPEDGRAPLPGRQLNRAGTESQAEPVNYVDPRLSREIYRYALKQKSDSLTPGGDMGLIGGDFSPLNADKSRDKETEVRRLSSINPDWFKSLMEDGDLKMPVRDVWGAVEKAIKGEKLGPRQERVIRAMLDVVQAERASPEGVQLARERLVQARQLRAIAKQGGAHAARVLPDEAYGNEDEIPGHHYDEAEYDPRMTGAARGLLELAQQAHTLEPDETETVMEQHAKGALTNGEAAQRYWRIIESRSPSHDTESEGQNAAAVGQEPAGVARPADGTKEQGARPYASTAPSYGSAREDVDQSDLFGGKTKTQQALHDEQRRRDSKRNGGQQSVETGDPSDLFSQARHQTDIDDVARAARNLPERLRPALKGPEATESAHPLPSGKFPSRWYSKAANDQHEEMPAPETHTVNTLRVAMQQALGRAKVDRLEQAGVLKFHDTAGDIPDVKPSEAEGVQGYWDGHTMHLAADGIAKGDELPVAIHEAIHKVQEDPGLREDLRRQFRRLVNQRDPAAMRAILRIPEDTPDDQYHDDGIAYLAEEVAKTDAADRPKTFSQGVLDLVRRFYNGIRARFYRSPFYKTAQKFGVNLDLSPRDIAAVGRYELDRSAHSGMAFQGPLSDAPARRPGESQDAYAQRLMGSNKNEIKAAMDLARQQRAIGRANFKAMLAERARSMDTAEAAFHSARVYFDRAGDDANLRAIDQWENGQHVHDPVARQFFENMDSAFAQRIERVRAVAPDAMQHLIENYFPHLWEDSGKAAKWYQSVMAKRPLEGNKAFLKQRTWGTIKEGMASGLKPVSTNPVDLALAKLGQMDKFITLGELRHDLEGRGWLKTMRAGERLPDGYARVEDPAFQIAGGLQGYKAVPELIASDINRYLAPGLTRFKAFRAVRYLQNALLAARLGFSAFHAGFTTFDTAASHFGVAFQAAIDGDLGTAAKMLTKTLTSPLVSPFEGARAFNQFYGKTAADADTAAVLHALELGGARGRMNDATAHMGAYENLGRALRKSDLKGTAMHMLPGVLEGVQRWITHYLVPWQKMASRTMLMKFELDHYAEQLGKEKGDYAGIVDAMHPDALKQIAGKVVQDVDDRLGQLAYDNLFMNRIVKDVAQATIQSVGWNVGTFRTIVGGVADARRVFNPEKLLAPLDKEGRITDAHLRRITGRLSYLIGFHIALATIGSLANYLMTGQPPQSLKDMFYPRTGRKNPDGSDERIAFPTYFKDEYALAKHPLETVGHKLHPSWSIATELLTNKDFYGTEIHNPEDPWSVQAKQIGKYLAGTPEPYALENEQRAAAAGGGTGSKVAPFFGVTSAPADISRTKFQQFVAHNGTHGYDGFTRTPEQAEADQRVHAAENAIRTGQQPDFSQMDDHDMLRAEKEGRIPKPEIEFMRLGIEDKLRAYDMATPAERKEYHLREHLLHGHVIESVRRLPKAEQQAVMDRLRAL